MPQRSPRILQERKQMVTFNKAVAFPRLFGSHYAIGLPTASDVFKVVHSISELRSRGPQSEQNQALAHFSIEERLYQGSL